MKFAIADNHFNHEGIIHSCYRSFKNIWSMNAHMIKCWNDRVATNDIIYSIGDMIFPVTRPGSMLPEEILAKLNGRIIYIPSQEYSHERALKGLDDRFEKITQLLTLKEMINGEKKYITLCHYPMDSWPKSYHGSWQLHGHCHCRGPKKKNRLDVGVDGHKFFPWSFDEIIEYMENQKEEKKI